MIKYEEKLPAECFAVLPERNNEIVVIKLGENGYRPLDKQPERTVDQLNEVIGVTKQQVSAMIAGSMFGWDIPASDPDTYDETGKPIVVQKNVR